MPVSVKAGDRVVLPGFGGVPVKVGEEVSRSEEWAGRRGADLLGF